MAERIEQIKNFWGKELKVLPATILEGFDLDVNTKGYLKNLGLPVQGIYTELLRSVLLVGFYKDIEKFKVFSWGGKSYLAVGSDPDVEKILFCIEESNGIFTVLNTLPDFSQDFPIFINSDITLFLLFAQIYSIEYLLKVKELDDIEATKTLDTLEERFKRLDDKAWNDESNFWVAIFEWERLQTFSL